MLLPTARAVLADHLAIPDGVQIRRLVDHDDERGVFRELFRESWTTSSRPVQWNMVRSRPNVLRGFHGHIHHLDYLTMASGEMILGLRDFRPTSRTYGLAAMLRLQGDDPHLVVLPPAVGHGFYFPAAAVHFYGVSQAFDGSDEFGCRWDDPALQLNWPCTAPILSERDQTAGSFEALAALLRGQCVA